MNKKKELGLTVDGHVAGRVGPRQKGDKLGEVLDFKEKVEVIRRPGVRPKNRELLDQ